MLKLWMWSETDSGNPYPRPGYKFLIGGYDFLPSNATPGMWFENAKKKGGLLLMPGDWIPESKYPDSTMSVTIRKAYYRKKYRFLKLTKNK